MYSEQRDLDLYAGLLWVSKMHVNQVNPALKDLPGPGLGHSEFLGHKDGSHAFLQSPVPAGGLWCLWLGFLNQGKNYFKAKALQTPVYMEPPVLFSGNKSFLFRPLLRYVLIF